jgi:hypothetical protein
MKPGARVWGQIRFRLEEEISSQVGDEIDDDVDERTYWSFAGDSMLSLIWPVISRPIYGAINRTVDEPSTRMAACCRYG